MFHLSIEKNEKKVSFFILAVLQKVLMLDGVIENNDLMRYSFLYGSLLEMILFSLMLANRFNLMQKEKITMQGQLIEFKNLEKECLESEVRKRTQEVV